jgi:hypothetical protein
MDNQSDPDYISTLSERLTLLRQLNTDQRYASHVYVTNSDADDIEKLIYLPDVMIRLITASVEEPEFSNFSNIWQVFVAYNYTNYMDGSPLDMLALATAWLAVGISIVDGDTILTNNDDEKIEDIPEPFYELSLASDSTERTAELFKIIDEQIHAAIQLEYSTNLAFTRVNLITAAVQFFPMIRSGLESQVRLEKTFTNIIKNYKNTKPLAAYDDILDTGTFVLDITDDDGRILNMVPESYIDLFDNVACSPLLPVCIFNGDEVKTGKAIFQAVNNRIIKTDCPTAEALLTMQKKGFFNNEKSLRIVMYVYVGEKVNNTLDEPMSQFAEVIFSFKKGDQSFNKFTITFKYQNLIDVVIERLNNHLVNYKVATPAKSENQIINITQAFIIPSLTLDKEIFMFFATVDVGNSLFKFDEHDTPWSQKKILNFMMLLVGHVKFTIKPKVIEHNTVMVIDKGQRLGLIGGDHIVKITLTAQNMEQYNLSRFIILRFFANYVKTYEENYKIYNAVFPRKHVDPFVPVSISSRNKGDAEGNSNNLRTIKQLRVVDPPLWMFCNYTRVAASNVNQQVRPISESKVSKYLQSGRMVIKWPVEVVDLPPEKQTKPSIDPQTRQEIRVYYTTYSDENPFIALIPNQGPNAATHPYLPKCQKTSSGLIVNADWTLTLREKEKNTVRSSKKTLRLLPPGETGPVNGSLNHFIGSGNPIFRYGVPRSKSSFLHCVLFAASVPGDDYRNIHTLPEAEDYVAEIRSMLAPFASACLQENPGKSIEEIAEALQDPDVYLDPALYYRACEENFGINIFIAGPNNNKELLLQPPNFSSFYTRTKRRPLSGSMVVIKLPLPHIKDSNMFQCEVLYVPQGEGGSLFTNPITEKLEEAFNQITKSIKITPTCVVKQLSDDRVAASQVITIEESTLDTLIPASFLSKLTAQYVDVYGKCVGVRVGFKNGINAWVVIPPIEPLSGPNVGDIEDDSPFEAASGSLKTEQITPLDDKLTIFVITELFGNEDIQYVNHDNHLVGIWSTLFGLTVYLPLKPTPWLDTYSPVRYNIAFNSMTKESPTLKLQRLQRVVTISIQIMKRLYFLSGLTAVDFVASHMVLAEPTTLMTTVGGVRIIPKEIMGDFDMLLDHFIEYFPSLFQNRKLLCDSEQYYANMRQRLINFEAVIEVERRANISKVEPEGNSGRLTKFPSHLDWFYVCYDDFTMHTNTQLIFMSTDRLNLEIKMQKESTINMAERIKPSLLGHREPYLYLHTSKKYKAMFLVQNVENGDLSKAATVSTYWAQNRVNLGYFAPQIVPETDANIISADSLEIEDPFIPMVVKYQSGQYAALLGLNEN